MGILDAGRDAGQDLGTSRLHQLGEFFGALPRIALAARMRENEYGTVAFLLTIKHEGGMTYMDMDGPLREPPARGATPES